MTNILKKSSCSVFPNQRTLTKHALTRLICFLMLKHWRNMLVEKSKHIATIANKSVNNPKCPALRVICFAKAQVVMSCGKTLDNTTKSSGLRENNLVPTKVSLP